MKKAAALGVAALGVSALAYSQHRRRRTRVQPVQVQVLQPTPRQLPGAQERARLPGITPKGLSLLPESANPRPSACVRTPRLQ